MSELFSSCMVGEMNVPYINILYCQYLIINMPPALEANHCHDVLSKGTSSRCCEPRHKIQEPISAVY